MAGAYPQLVHIATVPETSVIALFESTARTPTSDCKTGPPPKKAHVRTVLRCVALHRTFHCNAMLLLCVLIVV